MHWMHYTIKLVNYEKLSVQFYNEAFPQRRPSGTYSELLSYLKIVVDALADLINRYFFLFQPMHLNLSLEVTDQSKIDIVIDRINQIPKPNFIESTSYNRDSRDRNETQGEEALDFYHASAKFVLFRINERYKPGYNNIDETKLVHCFANPLFVTQYSEIIFYIKCAVARGFSLELARLCLQVTGFPHNEIDNFLLWDLVAQK